MIRIEFRIRIKIYLQTERNKRDHVTPMDIRIRGYCVVFSDTLIQCFSQLANIKIRLGPFPSFFKDFTVIISCESHIYV